MPLAFPFLSLNKLVMLIKLFLRANLPTLRLPNFRIITLALETVEEREILSVEALSLLLKRERRGRDDLDSWGDSS